MEILAFQSFVQENHKWFRGVGQESSVSFAHAESQLGFALPYSMKWLLSNWGYSGACGIGSLEAAVATTLRYRVAIHLPLHFMILDDWNDAGVVCLDSRNGIVIWMDACELERLVANVAPVKSDTYEDFPAWVVSRLEVEKEEAQYD